MLVSNRYARPLTAIIAATAVLGAAGAATAQTRTAQPRTAPGGTGAAAAATHHWKMYKTLSATGMFWDADASSWWNTWAVGEGSSRATPLAWRWNGHKWAKVAVPSGTPHFSEVSAVSTKNTWLLAGDDNKTKRLLRWNNGKWTAAGTAHAKGVYHIGAAGANQLWAAGDGFVRHYDGKSWSDKKLPDKVSIGRIGVNHYNDVWAVGWKSVDKPGDDQPFAMHWNGSRWTTTSVPEYHDGGGGLTHAVMLDSVAFVGDDDVYAGGSIQLGEDDYDSVLVHWNGKKWSKVGLPAKVNDTWMGSVGVAPVSDGSVWFAWANRHLSRRTPSGAWRDYLLSSKTLPSVQAVTHIPGTKTSVAVGDTTRGTFHPFIALGK